MIFKKFLLPAALLSTAALTPIAFSQASKPTAKTDSPQAIHQSAIIIDTHADTPQRFVDQHFDLGENTPVADGHIDLGKIKKGNLGAEFFSIWVEPEEFKGRYAYRTLALIDSVYRQAARHPDAMTMAFSADDIVRAHAQHKFAALMGIEGGHSIENDLRLLRDYYRLGVRYMTLTWSNTNEWGDSSGDINNPKVAHHNGLTDFGKNVVREMNRLGMMVDISHVSDDTFYQALLVSRAPVIASHSSSRELTHHPRNMTDDMLRAVARNRGVVMVNFFSAFVDEDFRKQSYDSAKMQQREAEVEEFKKSHAHADGSNVTYAEYAFIEKKWAEQFPRPPLKALIDHIDHVAKVAGIDHVGLGSDFDGVTSLPQGIDSAADLPKITEALYARGYTRAQIHKILGGNLLRVMREVENTARQIQVESKTSDSLSLEDLELMVGNRATASHLTDIINQYGVNFDLTPERRQRLQAELMSQYKDEQIANGLLDTISKARRK
ncbi:MAG TPA: dipeptidase [Candidatus Angelobacter sp.]|nr:dipeptidase [Candidatus Angelobacter sp.]